MDFALEIQLYESIFFTEWRPSKLVSNFQSFERVSNVFLDHILVGLHLMISYTSLKVLERLAWALVLIEYFPLQVAKTFEVLWELFVLDLRKVCWVRHYEDWLRESFDECALVQSQVSLHVLKAKMDAELQDVFVDAWTLLAEIDDLKPWFHDVGILLREVLGILDFAHIALGQPSGQPERQGHFRTCREVYLSFCLFWLTELSSATAMHLRVFVKRTQKTEVFYFFLEQARNQLLLGQDIFYIPIVSLFVDVRVSVFLALVLARDSARLQRLATCQQNWIDDRSTVHLLLANTDLF